MGNLVEKNGRKRRPNAPLTPEEKKYLQRLWRAKQPQQRRQQDIKNLKE